jgi:hypothetical protein
MVKGASFSIPAHLQPKKDKIEQLEKRLSEIQESPSEFIERTSQLNTYMPGHSTSFAQSVGKISQLAALEKPKEQRTGPFDPPLPPSKVEQEQYTRKLKILEQPLSILEHIKDGTILPSDVAFMKSAYPEYHDRLMRKMMSAVAERTADGKAIPYHLKQSLSVFFGQPLDNTMTQPSIMAAQATFGAALPQPAAAGGAPAAGKRRTGQPSKLSKLPSTYLTAGQSRETRLNKT